MARVFCCRVVARVVRCREGLSRVRFIWTAMVGTKVAEKGWLSGLVH